jgi:hypothetical protein
MHLGHDNPPSGVESDGAWEAYNQGDVEKFFEEAIVGAEAEAEEAKEPKRHEIKTIYAVRCGERYMRDDYSLGDELEFARQFGTSLVASFYAKTINGTVEAWRVVWEKSGG